MHGLRHGMRLLKHNVDAGRWFHIGVFNWQ